MMETGDPKTEARWC